MTDQSGGMLLILNDVEPEHEDEFNLWYDTEHIQERVEVPGFLDASRYRSVAGVRKYCALYRTRDVGVFESEAYRQRLAAQTEWSHRILGTFVDPHRSVGRIGFRLGAGLGAFLAIVKLTMERDGGVDPSWRDSVMPSIAAARHIISASLFESVPYLSGPVAGYRPTSRPVMMPEDCVLLIEASEADAITETNLARIAGGKLGESTHLGVFSFVWRLSRQNLS